MRIPGRCSCSLAIAPSRGRTWSITCNYDGVNKHRTVIEDEVFIGSDTQLVAPVTIGEGADIGAGSTVTKDAPAGQLTISRAKQVTIRGWKRPVKKRTERD